MEDAHEIYAPEGRNTRPTIFHTPRAHAPHTRPTHTHATNTFATNTFATNTFATNTHTTHAHAKPRTWKERKSPISPTSPTTSPHYPPTPLTLLPSPSRVKPEIYCVRGVRRSRGHGRRHQVEQVRREGLHC